MVLPVALRRSHERRFYLAQTASNHSEPTPGQHKHGRYMLVHVAQTSTKFVVSGAYTALPVYKLRRCTRGGAATEMVKFDSNVCADVDYARNSSPAHAHSYPRTTLALLPPLHQRDASRKIVWLPRTAGLIGVPTSCGVWVSAELLVCDYYSGLAVPHIIAAHSSSSSSQA